MSTPDEVIRMEVNGLVLDPTSNVPIVVLRDSAGGRLLPIWIGIFEANAIAMKIENIETPRPMTHDLMQSTIAKLGGEIQRVVISDLQDKTFFAEIHLGLRGEESLVIDARPSDAIALALRAQAPIFAADSVLEKAKIDDSYSDLSEEERIKKILEELNPEDLGKYTM